MQLNTYLYFDGNCEEAFRFYEKLFGGKIESLFLHEGTPAASQVPPEWQKKVLHARMVIGETVLMASDAPPGHFHKQQGFSINIGMNDAAKAEQIFATLAKDAVTVSMPFGETFWAHRFGMLTDRFGIPWMINVEKAAPAANA
jgi:PhnB protein